MSSHRRESTTTPPSPPKRHAMRASKPITPSLDLPPSRRRAQSEVVRKDLTSGKWRIVGAWSSLRHSLNTTRREESENELQRKHSRTSSMRRDSTLPTETPLSAPVEGKTRKRVSLFVRRRKKGSEEMVMEAGEPWTDEEEEARGAFRRVQSSLVKPVADEEGGGEGGRYLRYAEEVADEVWEKEEEIIGEICLEDFADGEGEDVEWLENMSVDLSVLEPGSGRMSRRPSLKLEGGVRWVGNETEFAKFFAEVGLDEFLDVEEERLEEFEVGEDIVREWEDVGGEHNAWCEQWEAGDVGDIRELVAEFCGRNRRRRDYKNG